MHGAPSNCLMARDIVTVRAITIVSTDPTRDAMGPWEADVHAQSRRRPSRLAARIALMTTVFRDTVFLCHATPQHDETYWLETVHPDGTVAMAPLSQIEQWLRASPSR